jgi:hypothetical protein
MISTSNVEQKLKHTIVVESDEERASDIDKGSSVTEQKLEVVTGCARRSSGSMRVQSNVIRYPQQQMCSKMSGQIDQRPIEKGAETVSITIHTLAYVPDLRQ